MSSTTAGDAVDAVAAGRDAGRFFYGWVMVGLSTLALAATAPAQTFAISVFTPYMQSGLGLSPAQLSLAYALGTLVAALPMGYVGAVMDRLGVRRTLLIVSFVFGLSCVMMGLVSGFVTLFLAFLLTRLFGQGAMGLLSANTLPFWFERKLGTVEGVRHLGIALAMGVFPAMCLLLIHAVGWRLAWVVIGVGLWAVMGVVVLFYRDRPEQVGQCKDGQVYTQADVAEAEARDLASSFTLGETLRTRAFWILVGSLSLWACLNTGLLLHLVPLLGERGIGEAQAAGLFPVFAVCLAVMHLVGGWLADRLPLNLLLMVANATMAGVFGLFAVLNDPLLLYPAGVLMGMTQGLLVAVISPAAPRYFGRTHIGKIRGVMTTLFIAATSLGPVLLGVGVEVMGSYGPILVGFFIAPLPLVALAAWATRPAVNAEFTIADSECASRVETGD